MAQEAGGRILGINPSTLYRKIKSYGLADPNGMPEEVEDVIDGLQEEMEVS